MSTAYVLSGGASLGSIQVGMALALDEAGVKPELIIGTSVGAVNGGWLAGGGPVDELVEVWRELSRPDLFPLRPLVGLRAFLGRDNHFVPGTGLRHLLKKHLKFKLLEDAPIPIKVIAAEASSGQEMVLDRGPAIAAIMASAAIPGVFPPVRYGDHTLIDGGMVNNTPITRAIEAGATEVWVLSTGYACGLADVPKGAIPLALHAVSLLIQQRFVLEVTGREYPVPVHLIPAPCPISVPPTDFSQTDDLIRRAHAGTVQWLENGRPQAMPYELHTHDAH